MKRFALILAVLLASVLAVRAGYFYASGSGASCSNTLGDTLGNSGALAGVTLVGDDSTTQYIGAKFTSTESVTICKISVWIDQNTGAAGGTVTAAIYTYPNDTTGALVGTASDPINITALPAFGANAFVEFTGVSAAVTASTSYRVVLKVTTPDATNNVRWVWSVGSSQDVAISGDGSTWSQITDSREQIFRLYH